MSKDTAKEIIDLIFNMRKSNDLNSIINSQTNGLVLDLIGGEPFMNIDTMEFIADYFIRRCLETHDIQLLINSRFSISSNGSLYNNKKVQDFISKYRDFLSINITIDGPQEMHDSCRTYLNGKGNFQDAFQASQDLQLYTTKITIAPENLKEVNTLIKFFYNNNYHILHMNPIFEYKWTYEDATIYYFQLKEIADYLLDNNILDLNISVFNEDSFRPTPEDQLTPWCGGYGKMLAFDPQGIAYPCLRFMPSSLGENIPPIIIGNSKDGIYNTPESLKYQQEFKKINRRTLNSDECFNCPISLGCGECAAWSYQEQNGQLGIRSTNICHMHEANALANVYYWNKIYKKYNLNKIFIMFLSKEKALKIIDLNEYNMLKELCQI